MDTVSGRNCRTAMQCPTDTWTKPATRYFFLYPTQFSFENNQVAGNPKYRVLPDVLGKPKISGITWYSLKWLGISGKNSIFGSLPPKIEVSYTQKYPKVKKMPENTWSYSSTLLPDPNPTRHLIFFPIPDLILKKNHPLGTAARSSSSQWITKA